MRLRALVVLLCFCDTHQQITYEHQADPEEDDKVRRAQCALMKMKGACKNNAAGMRHTCPTACASRFSGMLEEQEEADRMESNTELKESKIQLAKQKEEDMKAEVERQQAMSVMHCGFSEETANGKECGTSDDCLRGQLCFMAEELMTYSPTPAPTMSKVKSEFHIIGRKTKGRSKGELCSSSRDCSQPSRGQKCKYLQLLKKGCSTHRIFAHRFRVPTWNHYEGRAVHTGS